MAVAKLKGIRYAATDPVLKHVYKIEALGQEGDHQTKGMACAVKVFGSRCLVTSSDVDCKQPFIMDRFSRLHSLQLHSSDVECKTFKSFSFLLLNKDITGQEQRFIFDLPLEVRSKKQGTFDVLGFGRSFTVDPKEIKLDKIKKVILGSPIVQNQTVVGVVGLNDKGEHCPFFIDHEILGQLEESLKDVNNGYNPKESEEKAAIEHSGENPGETTDVEDQQGGESSGQPVQATDGRTQPSGNTGPDNQAFMEEIQRAAEGGFECLRTACNLIKDKLPSLQMDEDLDFSSNGVDDYSQRLLPNTEAGVCALRTVGDGNCFYRAASVLAFGHQGNHKEMRLRTVVELATNSGFYLQQKDIGRRIAAQEQVFLQNSGEKDVKIDQNMLKTEFEIDVLDTAKLSTRASDWHLQALGTVLNRQVQSVFPECGAAVAREYYNALFRPRLFDPNKEPVKIMWTRTGGDITPFIPNHFVPLISVDKITCSSTDDLQDQGPATVKREEDKRDGPEKEPVPAEILARGPLAVKAYNKAIEQGWTRVMRLPIMLIGQEGSGKTSLKKSLRGQLFNEKEKRTDAIERDPSYFSVSTEIWSTGEANKESNAESAVALPSRVAELMVTDLMGTGKHAIFSSESENCPGAGSSSDTNSAESKETEAISEPDSSPKEIEQNEESFGKAESGAESLFGTGERKHLENIQAMQNVPDAIAACVEKLLQESEKKEENIYSVLWDFGGQSVYYTTHPLFLTPKAIYLLVYNLTRNPHDQAIPIVKQGTFKQKEDRYCRKTNEDYLHLWLSSVFSLVRKDWESFATGKLPERPPVILVCTHADKCARAKDLAREIYGSLLCRTKPYSAHLSKTYFVVDNTKSGSGDECPEVQRLRNEVREVAKQLPQLKESIPIKWLRFEEALRLKKDSGEPFISRDEARRVASNECGIDDDQQFNTLLNFLHDQRIVIHFDDTPELEPMVVLDPQWLIDLFRKVITVKPYDPTTDEEQFKELWQKLENEGILDDKLLQTMWKLNKEAADSLVAVMEKFSLLCNWPSAEPRKQYLVPSMLMCPPDEASADLLVTDLIPPLFLRFTQLHSASGKRHTAVQQYVQVPLGLFPRLVIKLVQWCIKEELGPLFRRMYQNLARFPIRPKGYSAVLLCHSSSIEIVIHRDPKFTENTSKVAIGCMVRSVLESILQRIRDEFFWLRNMEYEFCVLCPLCCNHRSVSCCHEHHTSGCEREECLHFWSEYELQMQGEPLCTKNTLVGRTVVPVEEFAPWFGFSAKQQQFDSELLCSFGDSLVKDAVVAKVRVMDELACRLDQPTCHGKRELPLTQYWVHLAEEFKVPEDVVMRCQNNSENSPTRSMLEFLEGRDPHFKVQYLKNKLGEIDRNDLVEKLEKCSLQDTATIRNLREDNPETLDSICLHMDHSKNWQTLGRLLDIPSETLQRIAISSSCTETILDLIEKRIPQLTVKDIAAALTEVQRNDVCVVLKKHLSESRTIADLRDNLDCLNEVAALLDKETPGVKNWLHFARKFGVSKDDCDHMKPKGNPSPTKMVMEYLVQVNPQLTLKKFIETLMKMQRKDVVFALKKFF